MRAPVEPARPPRRRRRLLLLLRGTAGQSAGAAIAGGAIIWFWLRTVPLDQVLRHARPTQVVLLLAVLLVNLAVGALRTARWTLIVRPIQRIHFGDLYWIQAGANLANLVIPIRAGDVSRLWWLSSRHGMPSGQGAVTLLFEHFFDIATTAAMLCAGTLGTLMVLGVRAPGLGQLAGAAGVAVVLTALVLATVMLSAPVAEGLARHLPPAAAGWVRGQSSLFRGGIGPLWSARVIVPAALISVGALALDGLNFGLLLMSLGVSVPVVHSLLSYLGSVLAYALPSPGGIGNLEVFGTWMLTIQTGLAAAASAGAVLLWHLVEAGVVVALGGIALTRIGIPRLRDGRRSEPAPRMDRAG